MGISARSPRRYTAGIVRPGDCANSPGHDRKGISDMTSVSHATPTHADWERAKMSRDADAIHAAILLTRYNDPERAKEYALKAVASDDRMTEISHILDGAGNDV